MFKLLFLIKNTDIITDMDQCTAVMVLSKILIYI